MQRSHITTTVTTGTLSDAYERNDMGTFTSFDYMLLVTDELVDEILALGDKVEITFPENLRMKLLQKIGRIRNRYAT